MTMSAPPALYVVDAVRSPRGRGNDKGSLKPVTPVALLAAQFEALAARHPLDTSALADVVVGCVTQTGDQGANIGKLAVMAAGWDDAAPAITVNRYCASGLSAVQMAGQAALAYDSVAVGAGVEMMSRVPMASDEGPLTHDFAFQKRLRLMPIGLSADAIATQEGFSREDCDRYAFASQQRAQAALANGIFRSVVPVLDSSGAVVLAQDETPRASTTLVSLAQLPQAFAVMGEKYGLDALLCQRYGLPSIEHVHHAGNSPTAADGASAVLLASKGALTRHGLTPRAVIRGMANCSGDRTLALTGAVAATQQALAMAGVSAEQIDLFEVNESFAALMLHYMRHMKVPHEKLNVNGGAIALGHAMGSTGSALVGMALDELERRDQRLAVVAICGAAGLASSIVIERLV
jgi:acetyl-CoA C-acetyltransferase